MILSSSTWHTGRERSVSITQKESRADEAKIRVVYGTTWGDSLDFLERDIALWYAYFFYASELAVTYGDFKRLVPNGVWEEMIQRFEWTEEGQPPDLSTPFDGGADVPGASDGDWHYPPAMKLWMPQEVQDRFGYHSASPVSGDYTLVLELKHESEIVKMMEEYGYLCERDDQLICAAHGITPSDGWARIAEQYGWPSAPPR